MQPRTRKLNPPVYYAQQVSLFLNLAESGPTQRSNEETLHFYLLHCLFIISLASTHKRDMLKLQLSTFVKRWWSVPAHSEAAHSLRKILAASTTFESSKNEKAGAPSKATRLRPQLELETPERVVFFRFLLALKCNEL